MKDFNKYGFLFVVLAFFNQIGSLTAQSRISDLQPMATKFYWNDVDSANRLQTFLGNAGTISVLADGKRYSATNGRFLYPGKLLLDHKYRAMQNETILFGSQLLDGRLFYMTHSKIVSNDAPGLLLPYTIDNPKMFLTDGEDFIVSNGQKIEWLNNKGVVLNALFIQGDSLLNFTFIEAGRQLIGLGKKGIYRIPVNGNGRIELIHENDKSDNSCFYYSENEHKLYVGTSYGYYILGQVIEGKSKGGFTFVAQNTAIPSLSISAIVRFEGLLWFGTDSGVFSLDGNKKCVYYNGHRWLADDKVKSLNIDSSTKVPTLIVGSTKGIAVLRWEKYSLAEKAAYYDCQVVDRHNRYGFNASLGGLHGGHLEDGILEDADNDGLWTAMYIAGQAMRYNTTKNKIALKNCKNGLLALKKSFELTPVPGFPARSYAPTTVKNTLNDNEVWKVSNVDTFWTWKSTTSSDEAIGHMFTYSVMADLVDDSSVRNLAIRLMDALMTHIVKNDLYLIDYNGKPTLWGKWNPSYVNAFPVNVGDRKLNSSNIISMLQSAYYFTKKPLFRDKINELITKYGYLDNLLRPMAVIGAADENADAKSKLLSDHWNHSDDEMYFLGYWGLYRYALTPSLKEKYKNAILDHWNFVKKEEDPLWDFMTFMSSPSKIDTKAGIAFLKQYPLDLIEWNVKNSNRNDIHLLNDNFMKQESLELISPLERPVHRHNNTMYRLDSKGGDGNTEMSAGDIWLLPYWLGRYLEIIAPNI